MHSGRRTGSTRLIRTCPPLARWWMASLSGPWQTRPNVSSSTSRTKPYDPPTISDDLLLPLVPILPAVWTLRHSSFLGSICLLEARRNPTLTPIHLRSICLSRRVQMSRDAPISSTKRERSSHPQLRPHLHPHSHHEHDLTSDRMAMSPRRRCTVR